MKKKVFLIGIFLGASLLFLPGLNGNNQGQEGFDYDFLIKNARIFDGLSTVYSIGDPAKLTELSAARRVGGGAPEVSRFS